jgi:phosphoribosylformimino-5-aminoimidazole carboxamide ribotide isomerase
MSSDHLLVLKDCLEMEILPAIDLRAGKCVRLRQGDYAQETIFGDDPAEMARRWEAAGATRLHLVDLDGAKAGRPVNDDAIRRILAAVTIPCELGGGIRDDESLRLVLNEWGVDRAVVGTQALKRPEWFRRAVQNNPGRIALGLDARNGMVATAGWLDVSQTPALELARQFTGLPLAAVIYTNIANDGMMQGVDEGTLADLKALAHLGLAVIASGGVTTLDDVRRLAQLSRLQPNLVGAIIGRALYEGTLTVPEAIAAAR